MIEIGADANNHGGSDGRTIGEILQAADRRADSVPTLLHTPTNIVLGPGTAHMKKLPAPLDLTGAILSIERGVPMPPAKIFKEGSAWLPLLKQMQVGDSVFFADATLTQLGYARSIAKKHDFKISIRAVTGGVRLWRVAAPGENENDGLGE